MGEVRPPHEVNKAACGEEPDWPAGMDADLWQSRRLALHFQWVVVDAVGAQADIDWAASRSTPPATSFQSTGLELDEWQ